MSSNLRLKLKRYDDLKRSIRSKLLHLGDTVIDDLEEEEEEEEIEDFEEEQVLWDTLPYNCLVKICMCLTDRDRYRMACVCRSWSLACKDPSLWRYHVFFLYCSQETPQALMWLKSRVQHLRQATIMCFGSYDEHRDKFLRALQRANLTDLDINGAAYWKRSTTASGRFVARIVRLVKTQRRLVGFQMRQAMLEFTTGMGVLNAIVVSSGNTIKRLGLEDFFGDDIVLHVPAMPRKFSRCIQQFPHLNEMTLNYEYLTDDLLCHLSYNGEDRTIHLNIVSWLTSRRTMLVTKEGWATVRDSKRDVRVYLILQNIRSVRDVTRTILLPEIPMNRLDLVGIAALGDHDIRDMTNLLQHVGDCYASTLTGFRLWSDNYVTEEIEQAILKLLRRCPQLVYLDLHMDLPSKIIGTLCGMQTNKAIRLATLRLARSLAEYAEFERYRQEVRKWYPTLKALGLDFHVRAESAPSHSARNEYVFIIADTAGVMDSEEENYFSDIHNRLSDNAADGGGNQDEDDDNRNNASLRYSLRRQRRRVRHNPYDNNNNNNASHISTRIPVTHLNLQ